MDPVEIGSYLNLVKNFYAAAKKQCRFDYELTYKTKEDYYFDGRTKFESVFYPRGVRECPDFVVRPLSDSIRESWTSRCVY